ncbi:MAG TPA: hypothetical protein VIK75_10050 [Calditerricola sp.]
MKGWPAPTGGWVANRNIARPSDGGLPQGAAILDNIFPTATGATLRRGKELYATLGDGTQDARALFSYVAGNNQKLFGATDTTIYDITNISSAENWTLATEQDDVLETSDGDTIGDNSTEGHFEVLEGLTSGDWSVIQFATTGGIYLVGVNGADTGFIYDGEEFYPNVPGGVWALAYDSGTAAFTVGETLTGGTSGATAKIYKIVGDDASGTLWLTDIDGEFEDDETITDPEGGEATADGVPVNLVPGIAFPEGVDLTTADLVYVWAYKSRLWFVQKDSLDAWYLPVDQIGGTLTRFPLGGVFGRGGSLLFGNGWSLDSGAEGGLSEQCVFISTEGEVAVYQGLSPSDTDTWSKVGVYRIGRPLGKRAWIRAGADMVIASSIGFVPLSQALQRDIAALSPSAVSYPIEDAWNEATRRRGLEDWCCEIWPEAQMVCVAPPHTTDTEGVMFVANARTGAWARFTNWHAACMEVFQGQLYFGSTEGRVYAAMRTGYDDGEAYTGIYMPLFEDLGSPAFLKTPGLGRAVVRAMAPVNVVVSLHVDFDQKLPSGPDASPVNAENAWGIGRWGQAVWGGTEPAALSQQWQSVGGAGYVVSLAAQVTSGSLAPLDAEIIRLEITYTTADITS